jgi:hypothetical protein
MGPKVPKNKGRGKLKRSSSTEPTEGEASTSTSSIVIAEQTSETPKQKDQIAPKKKPRLDKEDDGSDEEQVGDAELLNMRVPTPPPLPPSQGEGESEPSNSQNSQKSTASGEQASQKAPASDKKRKKRNNPVILTDEQEEEMVTFLVNNPCYYDRKIKPYKFGSEKTKLWAEQAEKMKFTADQLSAWWKNIRSTYGKLTAPGKSGSGAKVLSDREKWIMQNFGFMKDHISRVPSRQARKVSMQNYILTISMDIVSGS